MPSAQLPITRAPQEPATDLQVPCSRTLPVVTNGHRAGLQAPVHPEAAGREAGAKSRADHRRGRAAVRAIARWLRRALAHAVRAWALAAGVPPDLYH